MRTAGIRELKNELSKYLRLVHRGETVLVTDRGIVVALLGPPPVWVTHPEAAAHDALDRLARAGKLRRGTGPLPSAQPDAKELPAPSAPIDAAAALDAIREDRS